MHAKYEVSISNGSKVMLKVTFFLPQSRGVTDRPTDRTKARCPEFHAGGIKKILSQRNITLQFDQNQTYVLDLPFLMKRMPTGMRKDEEYRYFGAKSKRRQFCVFSLFCLRPEITKR